MVELLAPQSAWPPTPESRCFRAVLVTELDRLEISERRLRLSLQAQLRVERTMWLDDTRALVIPDLERERAEAAIEAVANIVAIAAGGRTTLFSPSPSVALGAETDDDGALLADARGTTPETIRASRFGVPSTFDTSNAVVSALEERLDGVALLAEALSHSHPTGQMHEFMRVFERAFAKAGSSLIAPLTTFLTSAPAYGYSKTEVSGWILDIRHPATHADRQDFILQAHTQRVVLRLRQAAYDTLLNKKEWRSPTSARRDVWRPTAWSCGPLQQDGIGAVPGSRVAVEFSVSDEFGAYRLLNPEALRLGDPPAGWFNKQADPPGGGSAPLKSHDWPG